MLMNSQDPLNTAPELARGGLKRANGLSVPKLTSRCPKSSQRLVMITASAKIAINSSRLNINTSIRFTKIKENNNGGPIVCTISNTGCTCPYQFLLLSCLHYLCWTFCWWSHDTLFPLTFEKLTFVSIFSLKKVILFDTLLTEILFISSLLSGTERAQLPYKAKLQASQFHECSIKFLCIKFYLY